jgi:colanic acid biosynthesis glycosyl transferase WcaI
MAAARGRLEALTGSGAFRPLTADHRPRGHQTTDHRSGPQVGQRPPDHETTGPLTSDFRFLLSAFPLQLFVLKILLLNQTFYPDVVSTAQHLSDLAVELVRRGHEVTVVAGRRAYDNPRIVFPGKETWRGVRIHRVFSTSFGKQARWRRAADFASFVALCSLRLALLPRHDVVVALTTPPLISYIGAWRARLWRARFCYWVMDFNPDEAIAAGWLRADSVAGKVLDRMSRFSLRRAHRVIALDHFMRERIAAKGVAPEKISVIPPWSHDGEVRFDSAGREAFRKAHGLADKFVVMYSGNHSPCHPLDTLLDAARKLDGDERFVFLFVGGGSEFTRVQQLAGATPLRNVRCLPYQPLNQLAGSLSAADLHVVVMGEPFVGLIHPCKIYNVLAVGAPVLCIGPEPSHLSEILGALGSRVCARVRHGDADGCAAQIRRIAGEGARGEAERYRAVAAQFSQGVLLPRLVAGLESAPNQPRALPAESGR